MERAEAEHQVHRVDAKGQDAKLIRTGWFVEPVILASAEAAKRVFYGRALS